MVSKEGANPAKSSTDLGPVNSRDVAVAAGVSQATVSRALSGHPNVRPETRARVLGAAESLGYTANAVARSLIQRRTFLLGLVVSNISDAFAPEIIEGVTSEAIARGYTVIVGCVQEQPRLQADYLRMLAEHRVDGAIFASGLVGSAPDISPLVQHGLPIVLAGRGIEGLDLDSVSVDNASAAFLATTHLLDHGRRALAFVGGSLETSTTRDRIRGFREALDAASCDVDTSRIVAGEYSRAHGYAATRSLLALAGSVDGIVAADDTIALGCLDAAMDAGIEVPGDLALVGFGDQPAASLRAIALTTIRASGNLLGVIAVRLLMDRLESGTRANAQHVVLPHELVLRATCGEH